MKKKLKHRDPCKEGGFFGTSLPTRCKPDPFLRATVIPAPSLLEETYELSGKKE